MKKILVIPALIVLSGVLFFAACKKEDKKDDNDGGLDRQPMLTNYADNYVLPAYANMGQSLQALKLRTDAFANNPDEAGLSALRDAFKTSYLAWQQTDLLEFGPGEDKSLRMYMNTYPATVSKLEANIASGNYNLDEFGNKDAQGFPAVNYLLFGTGANSADIVAYYTTGPLAANRVKYLKDVTDKMLEHVQAVNSEWKNYRNTFVESTGTDVSGSLSAMVNSFVLYYERYLRSGKIGLPVGAMTGVAKPELTEAYYSPELSKELALTALESVQAFYEGKRFGGSQQGESMKSYLSALGTKDDNGQLMADLISTELGEAIAQLKGLNGTIADGVANNRPAVLGVYEQLQQVVPLLKVDMVSAFGISITYVDNDGD